MRQLSMTVSRAVAHPTRGPRAAWALVVAVLVIGVLEPRYLGRTNITSIVRDASSLALASCGQAIVILAGGFDLSAGAVVALTSVVIAIAALHVSVPLAFAAGLVTALAVGVGNGALVARFELPPFLVTLGTLTVVQGLSSVISAGVPISITAPGIATLGTSSLGPVPISVVVAAFGLVVLYVLLTRTTLGRMWSLVGSNLEAARGAGVRVRWITFSAYVVGAGFVGIAGLLLTSQVKSGQQNLAPDLAFEAITACAIGGLVLNTGVGTVVEILVGVLFLAAVRNGLIVLDLPTSVQTTITGVLLVAAVLTHGPLRRRLVPQTARSASDMGMS